MLKEWKGPEGTKMGPRGIRKLVIVVLVIQAVQ